VSPAPGVQRIAELLIRAACRRLPADVRDERCREWAAELPAILDDESIRLPFLRSLRALSFCAGVSRTTRQLRRSARASARRTAHSQWRTGALPNQPPNVAVRAVFGFIAWLVIVLGLITLGRALTHPPRWLLELGLAVAVGFDVLCVADVARSAQVRYLPKWAWMLICLIQTPGGGIAYLSIGRVGRPRPASPGEAKP
jgi:hypothetical protein